MHFSGLLLICGIARPARSFFLAKNTQGAWYHNHLDGSICQGGVAGGVIIGPRPSYGPEGGDNVEVMEPGRVED